MTYNIALKEPGPIASGFFSNFHQNKAHIFLNTTGEFYSWKMYRLEDINDITSCGNGHDSM